jgi:hypothetical protein
MSNKKAVMLPTACANWLAQNGCLIPKQLEKKGANLALGPDNVRLLVSGIAFGRAIQKAIGANKTLDGLRLNNKDGNWNTLVPILRRLAIRVENDAKSLILSGDAKVACRLMSQLYASFSIDRARGEVKTLGKVRGNSNGYATQAKAAAKAAPQRRAALHKRKEDQRSKDKLKRKNDMAAKQTGGQTVVQPLIEEINEEEMAALKMPQVPLPNDAETIPQFWCILLMEQLNVRAEQAVTLVTVNTNYLFHIFVNGIKGSFVPILNLCRAMFQQVETVVGLLTRTKTYQRNVKKDQRNRSYRCVCMTMNILRFGLLSNNPDVALWSCRIITHLVAKLSDLLECAHLQKHCVDWFNGVSVLSGRNGGSPQNILASGLNAAVTAIAKNPDLKLGIIAMIDGIANQELGTLFNTTLRLVLPSPLKYMNFICDVLETFLEERETMEEALMSQGVVKFWVDLAKVHCEPTVAEDVRQAAFHLITEIWTQIPKAVEAYPSMPKLLLGLLKKGSRDKSSVLNITAITCLFDLLDSFAEAASVSFAPYVYKTLIFSLIENHENELVYDFIMSNMALALERHPQVPVGVMVEPLTKQATMKGYSNVDFAGFVTLAKHPRLSLRHGLLLGDLLGKIAINDPIFGRVASIPLLIIINRFNAEPTMQEYVERFSKVALSMLMHIESRDRVTMRLGDGQNAMGGKKKIASNPKKMEEYEVGQIRRILILEILAKTIHLGHLEMVQRIEPLIKTLENQYKGSGAVDPSSGKPVEHAGLAALANYCKEAQNQTNLVAEDQIFGDAEEEFAPLAPANSGNKKGPTPPKDDFAKKPEDKRITFDSYEPGDEKAEKKNAGYGKTWLQSNDDADDEGDDPDLLVSGMLKVDGLKEVKNKRKNRIGRFKTRSVQEDIDRAGEALKQRTMRKQHEEERKRLRSRELRQKVRARFNATEEKRKAHAATGGGKNFKMHAMSDDTHNYSSNAPKRYMAQTSGKSSSLILKHQQEVYDREKEFEEEAVQMMQEWKKPLKWLYYMYAHADCGMVVREGSFHEQKMGGEQIGIREWQILVRDFKLAPSMGTIKECSNHYHSANISLKTEGDAMSMEWDEFLCAFRHMAREAPSLQEIPTESERIVAMMSFMRRQACEYDKKDRGSLKNRRMGDRRHWTESKIPLIEFRRTIPGHFGFTPQSVMCMEILDDLIFEKFGCHSLPNCPVPWNVETWDEPPRKWQPTTTEFDTAPVIGRNYIPRQPPKQPKKTKFKGFTTSSRRFNYQAAEEDKVRTQLDITVKRFGDSALKVLPIKWIKSGKIAIEILDKLVGDVIAGNARGRLEQRYGEQEKYEVKWQEYKGAVKNRKTKYVNLPWEKEAINLKAPELTHKESEKVIARKKRESEITRRKNMKRERERKKRQKELIETLSDLAKQRERQRQKANQKKMDREENKRQRDAERAIALQEKRKEDRQKIRQWRAQKEAEEHYVSKAEELRKKQIAAKNAETVDRINNKYHWEQARKEKARKEREQAERQKNEVLASQTARENAAVKRDMAKRSNKRRNAKREEDEAASKIQALYRGKNERKNLEKDNADYKKLQEKKRKKKKRKSKKQ